MRAVIDRALLAKGIDPEVIVRRIKRFKIFREKLKPGTLVRLKEQICAQIKLDHEPEEAIDIYFLDPGSVMMFLRDYTKNQYKHSPMTQWLVGNRTYWIALVESDIEILQKPV